jgi:hypothetical protein
LIEEALDVEIQNPLVTPASLPRHADRIERRFAGSISIGVLVEAGLHERLKLSLDNRLGDSVGDSGNTQWPRPSSSISFRYVDPSHRRRMITARRKPIPELVEVVGKISLEVRNRLAVDACRSLVGSNPLVRFPYFPLRNIERLCPIHEVPPIAG